MRRLILQGKHHGDPSVWAWAAGPMVNDPQAHALLLAAAALVPIPLAPNRRMVRGYNQSACLARALGKRMHKPVLHLLRRTNPHAPQSRLTAALRQHNVAHGFFAKPATELAGYGPLVLIDDVITTGATLAAAAQALRAAGAQTIYGVALARHLRPRGTPGADGV